jgi:16S rRNA processing protein RimM
VRGGDGRHLTKGTPTREGAGVTWLPLGALRRPHGIRGEILLSPFNAGGDRAWIEQLPARIRWVKGPESVETELVAARPVAGGWLVRFANAESRETVAALVGGEVQIPRQGLPELGSDEFYVEDVVGCDVFAADGRKLGSVKGTFWNGAHDVMVVVGDGEEQLVPVVSGFVLDFDAGARRITVDMHD